MNVKRIKRKCNVRGCRNTDTFALSLTREMGNSVIMCKSCAEAAAKAMSEYVPEVKRAADTTAPPPLFYHGEAAPHLSATATPPFAQENPDGDNTVDKTVTPKSAPKKTAIKKTGGAK